MAFDIAIGPTVKAEFFSAMWAYGRHFRIMDRDMHKKTTFDCGISSMYDEDGEGTEYVGYVDSIIRVHFDSFDTVLIKGKWYNSIIRRGSSGTLVKDECGVVRIKVGRFMSESSVTDEPLVFPKDVSQVFYVEDSINRGWKLVVHVNTRSKRVFYKREREYDGESEEDEVPEQPDVLAEEDSTATRRGETLISVEADDAAGEDEVDSEGESDSEEAGNEEPGSFLGNDILESDDDEQEAPRSWHFGLNLPDLEANEVQELESDGEFEEESEPYAAC